LPAITDSSTDGKFAFELRPIYGITIPVIIRHKVSDVSVEIKNAQIYSDSTGNPTIKFDCYRIGDISLNGNIKATYNSNDGDSFVLFEKKGFSIYTPNKLRKFDLPITLAEGKQIENGKILLQFTYLSDLKKEVLAETEILLSDQ